MHTYATDSRHSDTASLARTQTLIRGAEFDSLKSFFTEIERAEINDKEVCCELIAVVEDYSYFTRVAHLRICD